MGINHQFDNVDFVLDFKKVVDSLKSSINDNSKFSYRLNCIFGPLTI